MMPLRSHRMPAIAPRVIGTLRATVSCNIPVKLNEPPEAAHVRNPMTKAAVAIDNATLVTLPSPRTNWAAPSESAANAFRVFISSSLIKSRHCRTASSRSIQAVLPKTAVAADVYVACCHGCLALT